MTTKFISLATGIVILDVYLQSQLSSSDPLFLFASNSFAVNAGLLILTCLMVGVSFRPQFKRWWSFTAVAGLAIILGLLGMIGLFFGNMPYSFPQVLMPLDYMFLLEASVVFGICALTYKHQPVPYKLSLPKPAALLNKFGLPVPKIPHSPSPVHGRRPQTV